MRKVLLTMAIACLVTASFAQIEKGAVLVSASTNLGFTNYSPKDGDSYSVFKIGCKVGYFVIDNLAFGLNVDYQKVDDPSITVRGLGVFGRYYVNGKIFFGAGYDSRKQEYVDGGDASSSAIPLEAGYAAFITDNIAIEPALKYELRSGDVEGSTFGLNVGFTLYLNRGN